ncbi:MAG TPA: NFACT family protein, partial [Nitrospira sp.]|nr:NFACT family protein [Nitrospira sp.]
MLREIAPVMTQGRIQKISQPGERVLVVEIRVPGETHRLLLSCEPQTTRLHLLSHPVSNPVRPPIFCQLLRAQLRGGRLEHIRRVEHERMVTLSVSTRGGRRTLVAELMGHKANLLLLDERGHVLGDLNGQRELVKQPYVAPAHRRSNL